MIQGGIRSIYHEHSTNYSSQRQPISNPTWLSRAPPTFYVNSVCVCPCVICRLKQKKNIRSTHEKPKKHRSSLKLLMESPRNPFKKMELIGVDRWDCLKIEYSFPSTAFIIVSFCWFIWLCLKMNYCKWGIALNSLNREYDDQASDLLVRYQIFKQTHMPRPAAGFGNLGWARWANKNIHTKITEKGPKDFGEINHSMYKSECWWNHMLYESMFFSWNHHISWIFLVISTLNARYRTGFQPEMSVKCHRPSRLYLEKWVF